MIQVICIMFFIIAFSSILIMSWYNHHHGEEEGFITITGKGQHHIQLHHRPKEFEALFCDLETHPACDVQEDVLFYKLINLDEPHPTLEIEWKVAGVREVVWRLKY